MSSATFIVFDRSESSSVDQIHRKQFFRLLYNELNFTIQILFTSIKVIQNVHFKLRVQILIHFLFIFLTCF